MSCEWDLLLCGGHVIDPRHRVDQVADVAIAGQRIAAVAKGLEPARAARVVDVGGLYVFPGLIDIHVHVFGGYDGWLFPDPHSLPYGVTTVADAGGAGWRDLDRFRQTIIQPARTRVLAFVNIVGAGMTGPPEQDVSEMDAARCAAAIRANPDIAVGAKSAHHGGTGWESAAGAIEAARLSGTVAMVDFAPQGPRTYAELLRRMSPGDMHTHMYAAHIPLLDADRRVQDYVWQARERGVIFDTGHGGGSFWFRIAVPALAQGFPPDAISTDLHKSSRVHADATMPTTMGKFLAMGMALPEVVWRSTQRPAELVGRPQLGHLGPGGEADVAVFGLRQGQFGFVDSGGARLNGSCRFECELTIRAGQVVWDLNGRSKPEWSAAGEYRRLA